MTEISINLALPSFEADEYGNINGEQIHQYLSPESRYRDFITSAIDQCLLSEGVDFKQCEKIRVGGGKPQKLYTFTPDAVKAIGMKKGTGEQGKAIRDYFIEAEKTGRQLADALKNADPAVLRKLADVSEQAQKLEQNNRILETSLECAEETIKNIKPMAEYGQKICNSKNTYTATNVADELGMSANKLNTILRQRGVIKRGTGSADYSICSKFKKYDLAVHLSRPITHSNGEVETKLQLRWTRKGFDWLLAQLGEKQEKGA